MSIEAAESLTRLPGSIPASQESPQAPDLGKAPPRNFLRQAMLDTVSARSAQVGLAWLAIIAIFAIFSPFIANSNPIAMKMNGQWSSPLIRYLTRVDVLLLVAFFATVVTAATRKFSPAKSAAIIASTVIIAVIPCYFWVRPPENPVYEQYREWAAEGKIEKAWYALVPFSPGDNLRDQSNARLSPPGRTHWLGTDTNGADLFSSIVHASRIALSIGFISTGIAVFVGILVGGLMGYFVGSVDLFGMRLIEIFEAIPRLLLLITVTAFIKERSIYMMMTVIGLTSWNGYARFLRGEFLTLRKLDFVQAAIAAGLPKRLILFRHMLVNGLTPILVSSTFGVAGAIITESFLSFLGLGLVGESSWGSLLNQARAGGAGIVLWIAIFPGLAIFLTVFAYNLVGESVRDALDPKLRKRD